MSKIHILWATARPLTFIQTHNEWLMNADNEDNFDTHVIVDNPEHYKQLKDYGDITIMEIPKLRAGVTWPCYNLSTAIANSSYPDDDIVVFASDDFFPPENWDVTLLDLFEEYTGAVLYNDTLQYGPVVTCPIMDIATLRKLNGIIYHPAYNHSYSDNELYDNLLELNLIKDLRESDPDIIFEHRHHGNSHRVPDNTDRSFLCKENEDRKIYLERKELPLSMRLKHLT